MHDSRRVAEILKEFSGSGGESRGRRHWWFSVNAHVAYCSVWPISRRSRHFEIERFEIPVEIDQIAEAFFVYRTPVEYPTDLARRFGISTQGHSNRVILQQIAEELANSFDGINCGVW